MLTAPGFHTMCRYGTVMGGLLSEKFLDANISIPFAGPPLDTPSLGKYKRVSSVCVLFVRPTQPWPLLVFCSVMVFWSWQQLIEYQPTNLAYVSCLFPVAQLR